MVLLLTRDDIECVLQMGACIDAMEKAFSELANGTARLPLRINIISPKGLAAYMPAYLQGMNALACKVVTVFKDNPKDYNLPTILGKVLLQDPETGDVISIMDGGYLTAMRTGAASGLATRYLAREDEGQVAGIFGAGIQGETQLWAVYEARSLSKALVYDIDVNNAQKFAEKMGSKLNIPVEPVSSSDAILKADIICTATTAATPIFNGEKIKKGSHINGIGSHMPKARELDTTTIQRSLLIADSREGCLAEAGDIMIPIQEGAITKDIIHAELGEVVTGKAEGRTSPEQITLFKSVGLAIQDAATAKLVYDKAIELGVGKEVEL
ncbi:MAG: hypothetical protein JXA42_26015 [Anaerolineales bacterium]|nr:hypothetical protein [Anaerolineales bacterium]